MIQIKRIYEPFDTADGHRVLVDRLWPRGIRKADAQFDEWLRDIAPSHDLRTWFDHDPIRWEDFARRYAAELASSSLQDHLARLRAIGKAGTLTLLYAARSETVNHAVVLRAYLADG